MLAAPDQPDCWYHILILFRRRPLHLCLHLISLFFCVEHKLVSLSGNQNASEASADADEGENLKLKILLLCLGLVS